MFATKVEHFLCLGNASDGRAREAATPQQETKGGDDKRFRRCADKGYVAVAAKELDVGVNVVFGRDSVEDEVKAAGVLLHLISMTGNNNVVSAEAKRVFLLVRRSGKDNDVRSKRMSKLHSHVT